MLTGKVSAWDCLAKNKEIEDMLDILSRLKADKILVQKEVHPLRTAQKHTRPHILFLSIGLLTVLGGTCGLQ